MEGNGTPTPGDAPAPPPPPRPVMPTGGEEKASGGWRALGVVLALALAFAGAVMIAVGVDLGDTQTCPDLQEELAGQPPSDDECFGDVTQGDRGEIVEASGSSTAKGISTVLAWASGIVGAIAALVALFFAATGRQGQLLLRLTGAAVVIGGVGILVGSL